MICEEQRHDDRKGAGDPFPTCLIGHRDRDGHGLIVTPGGRDTFIGDDVRPNPVVIGCRFRRLDRGRDADFRAPPHRCEPSWWEGWRTDRTAPS